MGLLPPWKQHSDTFSFHACDCCRTHVWVLCQHGIVIADPEILQVSDVEVLVEVKGQPFLFKLKARRSCPLQVWFWRTRRQRPQPIDVSLGVAVELLFIILLPSYIHSLRHMCCDVSLTISLRVVFNFASWFSSSRCLLPK